MKLKRAMVETRKKTLEDANILMGWLYSQEKGIETIRNLEKSFLEELKLTTGGCIGVIDIYAEYADGSKTITREHLSDVVKSGLTLSDDVANFYIDFQVLRTDRSPQHLIGRCMQRIFVSDIFYIKENCKEKVTEKDGIIIDNMDRFTDMSANHIRFQKVEQVLEV